jgi:hypothetical protein
MLLEKYNFTFFRGLYSDKKENSIANLFGYTYTVMKHVLTVYSRGIITVLWE